MTTDLVITKMEPGSDIEANFTELQKHIEGIVAEFKGVVVTPDTFPQAKKARAFLNGLSKSLNQRRLDVKREYMAPVVKFEEAVKILDSPIKEASEAIDVQVKAFEEDERNKKHIEIAKHYAEYAGLLADVVPFDRIDDPKWLTKSESLMSIFEEVETFVDGIAKDYETIEGLGLAHETEAKATLYETLSLSKALQRAKDIDTQLERAKKLDEEKAAMEAERAEPIHEPVPEPVPVAKAEPVDEPALVTFTTKCTEAQRVQIGEFLRSLGLAGTFRVGA